MPVPAVGSECATQCCWKILEKIRQEVEKSPWNRTCGQGRLGIIVSGISRAYLHDVLLESEFADRFKVLELGFTWPLPEGFDCRTPGVRDVDEVLVLEELEPLWKTMCGCWFKKHSLNLQVKGRMSI